MTFETLRLDRKPSGVAVITLTRTKALNALNTQSLRELFSALTALAADTTARVVVLTGEGEKAFIAGADILEMQGKSAAEGVEFARLGHSVARLLETLPQPTIAAVNGFALGGGTEMAIACDFILASERAVFGQPEVGLGIIPGFGGNFRLAQFVGWPRAKELIFSGRKFKAPEALEMGLVNAVFPAASFMDDVLARATEIAQQSNTAVRAAKRLMAEFSGTDGLQFRIDAESLTFGAIFGSPDQKEGMGAFAEKRKPNFGGLES